MKTFVYRIELLEPVLVSDIEGDPNSAVAFDYLPGSVLRGAFIGCYLSANTGIDLAADAIARRLFFNGQTRYLNGYRLDRFDQRSLPTPRSWQEKKDDEKQLRDFAREEPPVDMQWNSVKKSFRAVGTVERRKIPFVEPDRRITVHTARTRRFGRAMPEEALDNGEGDLRGAVYRYEALAAGQMFEAVILCEDADETALKPLVQGKIRLGKSRSGGYGRAQVQVLDQTTEPWREYQSDQAPWRDVTWDEVDPDEVVQEEQNQDESLHGEESSGEAAPGEEEQAELWLVPGGQLVVTLLSDALLRDDLGQYVVDADVVRRLLERELDCQLGRPRVFLGERVSGGFNRKWGLPLPQAPVVAMGSVFVYEVAALNRVKVNDLLEGGIGERRAEGFGRLAINWQTEDEMTVDKTTVTPSLSPVSTLTGASAATARLMSDRLLRQKLDRKIAELANRVGQARGGSGVMDHPPRNSQIARLRGIIHEALRMSPPNLQTVQNYLNDIGERAAVRRQFERARIKEKDSDEEKNLLRWLADTLGKAGDTAWKKRFEIKDADLRGLGGTKPQLSEPLRHEYLLRFVDAVLARAAKQAREEG